MWNYWAYTTVSQANSNLGRKLNGNPWYISVLEFVTLLRGALTYDLDRNIVASAPHTSMMEATNCIKASCKRALSTRWTMREGSHQWDYGNKQGDFGIPPQAPNPPCDQIRFRKNDDQWNTLTRRRKLVLYRNLHDKLNTRREIMHQRLTQPRERDTHSWKYRRASESSWLSPSSHKALPSDRSGRYRSYLVNNKGKTHSNFMYVWLISGD